MFPGAVAVIDGCVIEYEDRRLNLSSYFTVAMDNRGNIVFIQSGFLGHNSDSGQFQLMANI